MTCERMYAMHVFKTLLRQLLTTVSSFAAYILYIDGLRYRKGSNIVRQVTFYHHFLFGSNKIRENVTICARLEFWYLGVDRLLFL